MHSKVVVILSVALKPLVKQLTIRPGHQKTMAKSLVIPASPCQGGLEGVWSWDVCGFLLTPCLAGAGLTWLSADGVTNTFEYPRAPTKIKPPSDFVRFFVLEAMPRSPGNEHCCGSLQIIPQFCSPSPGRRAGVYPASAAARAITAPHCGQIKLPSFAAAKRRPESAAPAASA